MQEGSVVICLIRVSGKQFTINEFQNKRLIYVEYKRGGSEKLKVFSNPSKELIGHLAFRGLRWCYA